MLQDKSIKDFILIHTIFAVLAAITLLFPLPTAQVDGKMLVLVILYNALIIVEFNLKGHEEWKSIWLFSFILSLFMVFPDWYLAETLGALVFPTGGLPMIGGAIPLYMAGLWSIPFFIIIFVGKEIQKRKSIEMTYCIVAILGVLIFVLSELTLVNLPSWTATVTGMTGNLAWYIIIPELILALSAFICYENVMEKKIWMKVIGAFTVMIFYIGNASFFYFLIETLLL
ncbi:MAG: hypothetical protein E4H14_05665 [Candidatus Thorarchaeota archaeon]|nr:MAG: hypothetical protein E4H14_05665 [Candidatus Thorarchaeota archaeon]